MSYIRKSFLFVLLARVQAYEGSGEETQIDQTPVYIEEPYNCWSCVGQPDFDSCLQNGQKEYCSRGKV